MSANPSSVGLVILSAILGLLYAFLLWVVLEGERGCIKGELFTKIAAAFLGWVGGLVFHEMVAKYGWEGAVVAIVIGLGFLLVQGCAGAL